MDTDDAPATHPAADALATVRASASGHWWSYAAAVAGMASLVASVLLAVRAADLTAEPAWWTGFAFELGQATLLLVLVALILDVSNRRIWALLGAAAYVIAQVLDAFSTASRLTT